MLAFANITGDAADEWIGQGIAEALTADFAKIGGLAVIPREHVFELQRNLQAIGRGADDRHSLDLGRRLGAMFVVTGAYQGLRDRVRITGQVIEVPTGRSAATVKLDGTIDQIFDLQDQLVQDLARTGMAHELATAERDAIAGDTEVSLEAFEAYSRGMLNLRMASRDALDRGIAKKELLWIPFFGWALWAAKHITVDRADSLDALKSLKLAKQRIAAGISVVVFPEGTRSMDGKLLPFKRGGFLLAVKTKTPIVPVTINGTGKLLARGEWRVRPGAIDVTIGVPIAAEDFRPGGLRGLSAQVQEIIAANLRKGEPINEPLNNLTRASAMPQGRIV